MSGEFLRSGRGNTEGSNRYVALRPEMAVQVAEKTGGNLVLLENNRWAIQYKNNASIMLVGSPTSESPIPEYTIPYLMVSSPTQSYGRSLEFVVPILDDDGIRLVNPGARSGYISGYSLKDGELNEFEIPTWRADADLLGAKLLAEQRFYARIN